MSYLLHLWREPQPVNLAQAESLFGDLRQQLMFKPDPLARVLVDALNARIPDDYEPDDCWNELPDPEPASPVLTLSPSTGSLEEIMPCILEVAREHRWVVYDAQAGCVWMPDGRLLERHKQSYVSETTPPKPEEADSHASRNAWIRRRLAPVFEHHGFRPQRGENWFVKRLPIGEARCYGRPNRDGLSHSLSLRLNYPERLSGAVNSDGGPELVLSLHRLAQRHAMPFKFIPPPPLFQSEPGKVIYELSANSASSLEERANELERIYGEFLLQWLDTLQSFAELHRLANVVADEDCPFNGLRRRTDYRLLNYHPDLLIASAVDAPEFEAMARQRLALYKADAFGSGLLPQLRALLAACGFQEDR